MEKKQYITPRISVLKFNGNVIMAASPNFVQTNITDISPVSDSQGGMSADAKKHFSVWDDDEE